MYIRAAIHNFGSWVLLAIDGASFINRKIDGVHPDVLMRSIVWQEGLNVKKDGNASFIFLPKYW